MGNVLSPSSSKRSEIEALVDSILGRVAKNYVTAYGTEFLKEQLEEDQLSQELNKEGPRDFQLRFRPFFSFSADQVIQGSVTKQGAIVKNWKRRFLVVHPNYIVDYYEAEEDFWKGKKPKGSINADGYNVVDNAKAYAQSKREEVASFLGGEPRNCPVAEEFTDTTFVIAHVRRRPYFIQADSMQEKDSWIQVFRRCCRYANGRTCRDSVGIAAFDVALRKTYWSLGHWTYPNFGGTEEQILSDLVFEVLNPRITREIQGEIPSSLPWSIKTKLCGQVLKALHSLVTTKVSNAYEEMQTKVNTLRTRLESFAEESREEIVNTREKVTDKIRKRVWEDLSSEMTERTTQIAELIEAVKPVMVDTLVTARGVFEKEAAAVIERVRTMNGIAKREQALATIWKSYFLTLDYIPRRAWQLKETFSRLAEVRAVLERFKDTFPDMPSVQVESFGNRVVTLVLDAVIFTFQGLFVERFDETVENPLRADGDGIFEVAASILNKVLEESLQMWDADIDLTLGEFYEKCVTYIVVPEVRKKFDPLHKPLIDLVSREVPVSIQCVLCARYQYEDLVEECVVEAVDKVLRRAGEDTRL